ncbi:hypothetical protein DUNSADRAFT_14078 [Dunaliella salina]|uniref:Uncharacterized protein n=1 Tax=Dunaliella salina TaxID=3046 RepID=A0ABQ7G824_DUNSA|nr:hypothetical protein DUNSADRAFT_14078 [Dunaliella salina]|eukprot:KAF5830758.1 hypothetical protein DUNSADRAFT_14078 [Dunaliella salina]
MHVWLSCLKTQQKTQGLAILDLPKLFCEGLCKDAFMMSCVQAFDAYVAELSKDPVEDPGPGDTRGLATAGGDPGGASLLRCATLAAQATKYPDTDVNAVMEAVDKLAAEVTGGSFFPKGLCFLPVCVFRGGGAGLV